MRSTYRTLAYLVAAGVAIQVASVALGFFTILSAIDGGAVVTASYDYESNLGIMVHRFGGLGLVPLAALALLVVSFFTKVAGAARWAAMVFGLVVLQIALVFGAFLVPSVGALHGLNALALLAVAVWTGRRVTRTTGAEDEQTLDTAAA